MGRRSCLNLVSEILLFLAAAASVIALPLGVLALAVVLCYRQILKLIVTKFYPSARGLVDSFTQYLVYYDAQASMNIVRVFSMSSPSISADELRQRFQGLIHHPKGIYRRLTYAPKLFAGYSFWVEEPDFRIENHIQEIPCPWKTQRHGRIQNGESEVENFRLMELVSSLHSKPWDKGPVSPWEVLVLKDTGIWIIRLHHILADGVSLGNLFRDISDPSERPLPGREDEIRVPSLSRRSYQFQNLRDDVSAAWTWIRYCSLVPISSWSLGPDNGDHSQKFFVAWGQRWKVEDIKGIKNAFDVNFESVVSVAVASALKKFVKVVLGKELAEEFGMLKPEPLSGRPEGMTNYFSYSLINLPTTDQPYREKLRLVHKRWKALKVSFIPRMVYLYAKTAGLVPMPFYRLFIKNMPMVLSNFRGPPELLRIGGSVMEETISTVGPPTSKSGLVVVVCSWGSNLRISVTFQRRLCLHQENAHKFIEFVEAELRQMLDDAVVTCV